MNDGEILEMLLKEKNISIRDLATKANIPEQTLYSMKKRKSNRTGKEIKAKISKALGIPIDIWKVSKSVVIGNKSSDNFVNTDDFYQLLKLKNKDSMYVKNALDFLGYHYTLEEIEMLITNRAPIEQKLAWTIKYILLNDTIISQEELDIICKIRCLSNKSKCYLDETIKNLIKVDTYEDYELKILQHQLK